MEWVNATQVNLVDHGMYTLADPESKVEDLQWMVIVDCVILVSAGCSVALTSRLSHCSVPVLSLRPWLGSSTKGDHPLCERDWSRLLSLAT